MPQQCQLWCWTPVLPYKRTFPRSHHHIPSLPGGFIDAALKTAVRFYMLQKDKALQRIALKIFAEVERQHTVFRLPLLLRTLRAIQQQIDNALFGKQCFMPLEQPVLLNPRKVRRRTIAVFDVRQGMLLDEFQSETYQDILHCSISLPTSSHLLKAATHSYSEALAHYEFATFKSEPFIQQFYAELLNDLKQWELPLRIGQWTTARHHYAFLMLWKIKALRDKVLHQWKLPIQPRTLFYLPKQRQSVGWCEIKLVEPS